MPDNIASYAASTTPMEPGTSKAMGYLQPTQNALQPLTVMQDLCLKTGRDLASSINNIQLQNHNCLPSYVPLCSNIGYFPVCREQVRPVNYQPPSLQFLLERLRWNGGYDDDAWIKAVLVMNLVEAHLMIMTQNPRERVRFFPVDFATEAARQLSNDAKWRQLTQEEFLFLNILIAIPELQGKLSYDQLFNTDIVSHEMRVQLQPRQGSELTLDISSMLGLAAEHYPFLRFAALADMMGIDSISMVQKAYSLANNLEIDTANPFKSFLKLEQFPYNQRYALSTANFQLPSNLIRVDIRGEQQGIKQTLLPFETPFGTNFMPLSLISSTTCPYPKPMFLPVQSTPLFGLDQLYYSGNQYTLLTPSLATAVGNQNLQDVTVMSWWGNLNTIDLVEWKPLVGKTVYYLVHSSDFGGVHDKIFACLDAVRRKLQSMGCAFHIVDFMQPPQPQENPYA